MFLFANEGCKLPLSRWQTADSDCPADIVRLDESVDGYLPQEGVVAGSISIPDSGENSRLSGTLRNVGVFDAVFDR